MKELVTTCDHCGKKMDSMSDYEDIEYDTLNNWLKVDLCSKCYEEISYIIQEFCSRKHQNEK